MGNLNRITFVPNVLKNKKRACQIKKESKSWKNAFLSMLIREGIE